MMKFPVVVADDDVSMVRLLEAHLTRAGFTVFTCADGDEALSLVHRHRPVILLADWEMPGIKGPELCHETRNSGDVDDVYAILITGHSRPEEIAAGLDAGADDYLVKPVHPTVLLARVRTANRVLDLRTQQREHTRTLESEIAKRTLVEEALRESEEMFKGISTSAQDAMIMMDADGNISFWNEAAERAFGYTQTEVIGKQLHSVGFIVSDRFLEAHFRAWPKFQATGQGPLVGKTVEIVGTKKSGEEFFIEISLSAVKIKNRWHSIGVLRDITERKTADAKLRQFSVAMEQSPVSVVITDTGGTIEYVNSKFTEVTGYTAAEAVGQNPRILKSGKWPRKAYKTLWETIHAGKTWVGEFENRKKSGELFWEAASICPIRDAQGSITHFLAVKQDITQRKRVERQLQEAKTQGEQAHAETKQLLDAISSVLIGVDSGGQITAWNGTSERTFGIESEKALGHSLDKLGIEWDHAAIARSVAECLAVERPVGIDEMRFKRPDDTEGFLGITLNPVCADAGRDGGFLLVATDITEQKILQGQLTQAQKLESIGQLAAGIAHEINTPTQFVGDNTRFLQDAFGDLQRLLAKYARLTEAGRTGSVTPEILADVEAAEKEADLEYLAEEIPKAITQSLEGVERVSGIVRAMKDFSHPGAEGKEAVDLSKAIESTVTVARNEWKYVAEMVMDFDPALPPVPCLVGEFNQVILNIVINAAHAIAEAVGENTGEKGTITITTRHEGGWAEIRISDTGTGIPEAHQSKVFDHFFTTKEVGKGTGQGLSIAHAVVTEKHGGSLTLETEMGRGTTFIIRLPLQPDAAEAEETAKHEEAYSLR